MRISIARVIPSCRLHLTLLNIFVFHMLAMVVLQLLCPCMKRKILACRDLRDAQGNDYRKPIGSCDLRS